jgi:hypothetical protein
MTATVKREALRLVRLETERESFLTTPKHQRVAPGGNRLLGTGHDLSRGVHQGDARVSAGASS